MLGVRKLDAKHLEDINTAITELLTSTADGWSASCVNTKGHTMRLELLQQFKARLGESDQNNPPRDAQWFRIGLGLQYFEDLERNSQQTIGSITEMLGGEDGDTRLVNMMYHIDPEVQVSTKGMTYRQDPLKVLSKYILQVVRLRRVANDALCGAFQMLKPTQETKIEDIALSPTDFAKFEEQLNRARNNMGVLNTTLTRMLKGLQDKKVDMSGAEMLSKTALSVLRLSLGLSLFNSGMNLFTITAVNVPYYGEWIRQKLISLHQYLGPVGKWFLNPLLLGAHDVQLERQEGSMYILEQFEKQRMENPLGENAVVTETHITINGAQYHIPDVVKVLNGKTPLSTAPNDLKELYNRFNPAKLAERLKSRCNVQVWKKDTTEALRDKPFRFATQPLVDNCKLQLASGSVLWDELEDRSQRMRTALASELDAFFKKENAVDSTNQYVRIMRRGLGTNAFASPALQKEVVELLRKRARAAEDFNMLKNARIEVDPKMIEEWENEIRDIDAKLTDKKYAPYLENSQIPPEIPPEPLEAVSKFDRNLVRDVPKSMKRRVWDAMWSPFSTLQMWLLGQGKIINNDSPFFPLIVTSIEGSKATLTYAIFPLLYKAFLYLNEQLGNLPHVKDIWEAILLARVALRDEYELIWNGLKMILCLGGLMLCTNMISGSREHIQESLAGFRRILEQFLGRPFKPLFTFILDVCSKLVDSVLGLVENAMKMARWVPIVTFGIDRLRNAQALLGVSSWVLPPAFQTILKTVLFTFPFGILQFIGNWAGKRMGTESDDPKEENLKNIQKLSDSISERTQNVLKMLETVGSERRTITSLPREIPLREPSSRVAKEERMRQLKQSIEYSMAALREAQAKRLGISSTQLVPEKKMAHSTENMIITSSIHSGGGGERRRSSSSSSRASRGTRRTIRHDHIREPTTSPGMMSDIRRKLNEMQRKQNEEIQALLHRIRKRRVARTA